ncbi:MAG: mcmE [Deltaproteobacteria bacterium]|nr:mcmE [Deltaproteobacteria bacterium]
MPLKLDHIGFVVEDINTMKELFKTVGLDTGTEAVINPLQKVSASFVNVGEKDDIYVELLEPASGDSPISNFLQKKGGGLHHLCFEVDDIEKATQELAAKGFRMAVSPEDCTAYDENLKRKCKDSTKIAFFIISKGVLIELIEKGR